MNTPYRVAALLCSFKAQTYFYYGFIKTRVRKSVRLSANNSASQQKPATATMRVNASPDFRCIQKIMMMQVMHMGNSSVK